MEFTESDVVIVTATEDIAEVAISLVNLDEFSLSLSVALVGTWVVLDSQTTIGALDVREAGSAWHAKNFVIGWLAGRIILLEEGLLLLILETVLIEELIE